MEQIVKYWPNLSDGQRFQFGRLFDLYADWNSKINVISRKDIDNLYEHHVLHSLAIAKLLNFQPGTTLIDVGTGGGFPGIPLAILFPECHFTLLDSIGKKLKVAQEVASAIGLTNVEFIHSRIEEISTKFDFVISRAAMDLLTLVRLSKKNVSRQSHNALPNGLICLKGGDLKNEVFPFRNIATIYELSDWFNEEYFKTKKVVYMPLRS
ncbi:MAG: 16S rRNA (guanine(527)-N(7))-methyltransferase RsmG [Paludibacteraceae bacterium]|nr:16S rRNA (guanine(527)-N(7))-methyltransferase RsmG [Paludibacteraceae bacterium]